MTMDSSKILDLLQSLLCRRLRFVAVLSRDELEHFKTPKFPAGIVVNTDDSSGKGRHWVAYYITLQRSKPSGIYFDSYANPQKLYGFSPPFQIIRNQISKFLQPDDSSTCGQWSISFLDHMARGKSGKSFYSLYSKNLRNNDALMLRRFQKKFKIKTTKKCVGKHSCCPRNVNLF